MPTHVHEISHPAALVTAHMAHLHHRDLEAAADTMAQMKRVLALQDLVGLWAGATSVLLRMAGVSPGPESNITNHVQGSIGRMVVDAVFMVSEHDPVFRLRIYAAREPDGVWLQYICLGEQVGHSEIG